MRNDKFWDECGDRSIRKKVAEFIEHTPAVAHLKTKPYYDFEDALVQFIYDNREMISKEVDAEYHRDDLIMQTKECFGEEEAVDEVIKSLPIKVIDELISYWQEALNENDEFWEINWDELTDVLTDGGLSPLINLDSYDPEDILIYAAYLREWYSDTPPEMQGQNPVCIDEFFDNEMSDDDLSQFYIKKAKQLFGDKIKRK